MWFRAALVWTKRQRETDRWPDSCGWICGGGLGVQVAAPTGAQRGTTFTLTLVGQELTAGAERSRRFRQPSHACTSGSEDSGDRAPLSVECAPILRWRLSVRIKTGEEFQTWRFSASATSGDRDQESEADPDTKENIRSVSPGGHQQLVEGRRTGCLQPFGQ